MSRSDMRFHKVIELENFRLGLDRAVLEQILEFEEQ